MTPATTRSVLGLDIGGANLKAADTQGRAMCVPFPLWKNPAGLAGAIKDLASSFAEYGTLAVTMTGELCDCFETKREGVIAILDAVEAAASGKPILIWTTLGRYVSVAEARGQPLRCAAANWLALAHLAGGLAEAGIALLLDIGSTTADIILLRDGRPAPMGFTDTERLRSGELVYTGVRRTPLCALLGEGHAAEFFATTQDAYVAIGLLPEAADDRDTADGRPATRPFALARLARMLCGDVETLETGRIRRLAQDVVQRQQAMLAAAVYKVAEMDRANVRSIVISGSGEFLARRVVEGTFAPEGRPRVISLGEKLGPRVSDAACAYAVARGVSPGP